MAKYKIHTADRTLFVADYQGGFVFGEDSGYTWDDSVVDEVLSTCQKFCDKKLLKEAA